MMKAMKVLFLLTIGNCLIANATAQHDWVELEIELTELTLNRKNGKIDVIATGVRGRSSGTEPELGFDRKIR